MKDARGKVLYVGKAQSLRQRVRSYWQKQSPGGEVHRIRQAIDRVVDLEVTEVDSVSEALLLEANLIKRYKPRFNVRLKDDKSYPYIKVTLGDDFPRVERTRRLPSDGSRYFGPYASASSVDEAMNLVRRLFPFRTCTVDIREGKRALPRPCLLYHIKRCQGPCIEAISKDAYRADIAQVELFLEGNADARRRRPAARDVVRGRTAAVRAGGSRARQDSRDRADDGEPEDGRLRPDRAGPGGDGAEGRPGGRPAVRRPQREDARARRVLPRRAARRGRRRGARELPRAVLRTGDERAARGAGAARAGRHGGPRGVPGGEAWRRPCGSGRHSGARSAS